jgi:hypothetical protein
LLDGIQVGAGSLDERLLKGLELKEEQIFTFERLERVQPHFFTMHMPADLFTWGF